MPLTETRLRALKTKDKPYKVADQRGLYIEVTPAGGKLWRFRYRIGKIEKKLAIGSYPEVSLKQARDATYEARLSDVGEAVGLDHDYASLGDADKDRLEIHLRNLFADAFGQNFTASKLKIAFPEVEGSEICQIDVRPADAAVVISVADKNGLKSEKLYVRSGNSSPEMPMSEVQAFLGKRFGSTALV